jgi:hypothetical protein
MAFPKNEKEYLFLKNHTYTIIARIFYKFGKDGFICCCVMQIKIPTMLEGSILMFLMDIWLIGNGTCHKTLSANY